VSKFRHLPAVGRVIIVAVAFGVVAVAAVACATSYNAIYRLVGLLGLYGTGITQAFPVLLDAAFIIAEFAAVLGGIMRAVTASEDVTKGWPYTAMLVCGAGTLAFNIGHALTLGRDSLTVWRCVVASLPPVLMIISFQVLIAIVKWVMLHLGRPLNSAAALSPTGYPAVPSPAPGALYRPDVAPWGAVPPGVPGYGAGPYGPAALYGQNPSWAPSQIQQIGQSAEVVNQANANGGNGEVTEATKRRQVETHLARLAPDQLQRLAGLGPKAAARELTPALNGQGVAVSERYVQQILDEFLAAQQQANGARRRKH
jgi:hypothetical protein